MKEEIEKMLAGGGNYIGSYNEIKIDCINAEYFSLTALPDMLNQNKRSDEESSKGRSPITTISEDIIPPKLKPVYAKLDKQHQLMCMAIVLLQQEKDENKDLFRLDNDWWAVYSPMVFDEKLKLPQKPNVFYNLMQEIGMGYFKVNCTQDRMMKINGVFLKHYKDWKVEDYYGERPWSFFHKQKIASRLADILKQLHEQMKI